MGSPTISFHLPDWCPCQALSSPPWPVHMQTGTGMLPLHIHGAPLPFCPLRAQFKQLSSWLVTFWEELCHSCLQAQAGCAARSEHETFSLKPASSVIQLRSQSKPQLGAEPHPEDLCRRGSASTPCPGACQDHCSCGTLPQGRAHASPTPDQPPQEHPDLQEPAACIQLLQVCPVEGGAVQGSPLREHILHVGGPGEFLVMHEEWDPVSTGKGAKREALCCKLFVSYPCPGISAPS